MEMIGLSGRTLPDGEVCAMVGGVVSTSTVKLQPDDATFPLLSVHVHTDGINAVIQVAGRHEAAEGSTLEVRCAGNAREGGVHDPNNDTLDAGQVIGSRHGDSRHACADDPVRSSVTDGRRNLIYFNGERPIGVGGVTTLIGHIHTNRVGVVPHPTCRGEIRGRATLERRRSRNAR